ncbi:MAG: ATP-binding protein [Anaerolineae bacterium]|nr:ATP-binding protein [Anaerolineae bacterium]
MDGKRQQFQIYLPGLLKVLAESLYSSKKVAIRELLQNAHDSCIRRQVEHPEQHYRPRVDVWVDSQQRTVTVQDNGAGLTEKEVTEYLSTIGRSYTRELGEELSILSPEEAERLVGQFGLGFLSSFLIASEVTLTTQSAKAGSQALQWRSTGDVHYDTTPVEEDEALPAGTSVELQIKPAGSFILNEGILIETIQQYADFLPIPVYVNGGAYPVNATTPPWEALDPQVAIHDYIERAFNAAHPLAIIELSDQTIDLGHDTLTVPLKGFLFIPATSTISIQEYGDLNIYIRRMFICERQRDLLPAWARFVRGVIDCPQLQPTASREEIQRDDAFLSVQQALEEQLIAGLRDIARNDPPTWKKIVWGHASVMMGWAVQDNEFFDQIADIMTVRTSRGRLSMTDYLEQTGGTIYYVTRELGSLQEQLLGEGIGMPVIDASWFAVTPFLKKYAGYRSDIRLVQLDGEASQLLRPAPEEPFASILNYYRQARGVPARVVVFKPADVPAVIVYPKDAEFIKETRDALDADELPGPFGRLVSDYMMRLSHEEQAMAGTFYVNAACELIQQLAALEDGPARNAALDLVYQIARLFSGRMLDTTQITQAFRESAEAIKALAAPHN